MTNAVHDKKKPNSLTFRWMVGLLIVIGLGTSVLVMVIVRNESPLSAESSRGQSPASATPTPGSTEPALLADTNDPPDSVVTVTPEAAPSVTPNSTESDANPTPEIDPRTATPEATSVPESESASSPTGDSSGSREENSSSNSGQVTADTASTAADPSTRESTMRIEIPTIGVKAPIEVKSIDANGVMENPGSPDAVAWYDFTARPEDQGNAVFAGHLDYEGVGPAVFWELGSVSHGDEVNVTQVDGRTIRYRITEVRSVPADADASNIVASGDVAKITIITCAGSFDPSSQEYNQRIIVTGERVG